MSMSWGEVRKIMAFALAVFVAPRAAAAKHEIRWVLAHEPAGVFEQAAREFAEMVAAETKGSVAVRVIGAKEFGHGRVVTPDEAARGVASGEIEMTQTYTTSLGRYSAKLMALDMPYLFRDHEHASKVLDGEIGRDLLASLDDRMHGLAFTYSGGYRVLPATTREIHKPADMKGLRVRTSESEVAQETLRALGAEPIQAWDQKTVRMARFGRIDASETTLPRYEEYNQAAGLPVINDTQHSLFLTAVLINARYFKSLPKAEQDAISRAALKMAAVERRRSVESGDRIKSEAVAKGQKVVALTAEQQAEFVAALRPVYDQFTPRLDGFVERIQRAR